MSSCSGLLEQSLHVFSRHMLQQLARFCFRSSFRLGLLVSGCKLNIASGHVPQLLQVVSEFRGLLGHWLNRLLSAGMLMISAMLAMSRENHMLQSARSRLCSFTEEILEVESRASHTGEVAQASVKPELVIRITH